MGRPTDCTPEVTAKVCAGIRAGRSKAAACALAGISYAAFAEWHRRANDESDECQELYGKFVNEVARARADYLAVIEATFDKQVEDSGDWRGTLSKLKVFYPEIWNVPEKHELTGADGGPIQTQAQVVEIPAPIADVTAWAASAAVSTAKDGDQ